MYHKNEQRRHLHSFLILIASRCTVKKIFLTKIFFVVWGKDVKTLCQVFYPQIFAKIWKPKFAKILLYSWNTFIHFYIHFSILMQWEPENSGTLVCLSFSLSFKILVKPRLQDCKYFDDFLNERTQTKFILHSFIFLVENAQFMYNQYF